MSTHALFRPSGAHRWIRCASSLVWEQEYEDTGSRHADEGTAAHTLASLVLEGAHASTHDLLGRRIDVSERSTVLVTDEMAAYIEEYVDYVQLLAADDATLMVEQRVRFGPPCGQDDSDDFAGTADALILRGDHLYVVDLKYGRGVPVSSIANEQLMLYALGGLYTFDGVADIATVTMVIHQPRAGGVSEYTMPAADLRKWGSTTVKKAIKAGRQALKANDRTQLSPGEKTCRWCPAKAACPALRQEVQARTAMDFDDITVPAIDKYHDQALADAMAATDLVEQWLRAVRGEVERRLMQGHDVPGWKLVAGRKGARQWTDTSAVEAALVEALGGAAYEKKILSPAQAEKALRKSPHWDGLSALTRQSEGAPSVAPEADKRSPWTPASASDFDTLTEED